MSIVIDGGSSEPAPLNEVPQRERTEAEKDWPDHVWSVGMDRLDHLGFDANGQLYWNGRLVETRSPKLNLTKWQRTGAIVLALCAIVSASGQTASALADWLK